MNKKSYYVEAIGIDPRIVDATTASAAKKRYLQGVEDSNYRPVPRFTEIRCRRLRDGDRAPRIESFESSFRTRIFVG